MLLCAEIACSSILSVSEHLRARDTIYTERLAELTWIRGKQLLLRWEYVVSLPTLKAGMLLWPCTIRGSYRVTARGFLRLARGTSV